MAQLQRSHLGNLQLYTLTSAWSIQDPFKYDAYRNSPIGLTAIVSRHTMPRLAHRKSTTGCIRCKKRKVKCSEERPSCSACLRHQLPCEYPAPKLLAQGPSALSDPRRVPSEPATGSELDTPYNGYGHGASDLELRLFHYFISHTRHGIREGGAFWGIRAPLLAFDHRPVFDAMLALAALHMYRQILDDTFIFYPRSDLRENSQNAWTLHGRFLAGRTAREVYEAYLHYFDAAVKGQQVLMQEEHLQAAFVSSALITVISLVSLGNESAEGHESDMEAADARLWFNLAIGPRELIPMWRQRAGDDELRETGIFDDEPNFRDVDELFNRKYATPFEDLLMYGTEFETITPEESIAYQKALSYIGLIYTKLVGQLEEPLVTSRRFIALPGRVPPLYSEMVLQQRPRALAILAHAFAMMRLLEVQIPWYRGIAAKQVPHVQGRLPPAWQQAMKWPLAMLMISLSERVSLPDPASNEYRLLT